jgi:L,D-transpeptidase ErfK/SrfK
MSYRKTARNSFLLLCLSTLALVSLEPQKAVASQSVNTSVTRDRSLNALTSPKPLDISNVFNKVEFLNKLDNRLVLKVGERRVYLYEGENAVASYPVAVGKRGWETPTGQFQVIKMVRNPSWEHPWEGTIFPPGPDNPLGERWIGFWSDGKNTIGFHGTPSEHTIGRAASHGCVRMKNQDIKSLFDRVQMGTPVIVQP